MKVVCQLLQEHKNNRTSKFAIIFKAIENISFGMETYDDLVPH